MDLTLEGNFAKKLFALTKKDKALARSLARQWLGKIKPTALYTYLLDQDTALSLLIACIQKNPKKTIDDLNKIQRVKKVKSGVKKAARKAKKVRAKAPPKKAKPSPRKRQRMTAEEAKKTKDTIIQFLGKTKWATRKEISEVAQLSSQAIYRRIIAELKASGAIISEGSKSKTVYSLKKTHAAANNKNA